jgi:cytochrome c55X
MMPRRARCLMLSAVALAAAPLAAAGAGDLPRERTAALSYLVRQDCGACHGMTLKGGLGRPLLPEALAGADEQSLAEIILDGVPGTPMPPWRGELDEADALWIARALKEGRIE